MGICSQALLELGASPNYKDYKGLTPLYHLAKKRNSPVLCAELLLRDYATIGCKDDAGNTELHQVSAPPHTSASSPYIRLSSSPYVCLPHRPSALLSICLSVPHTSAFLSVRLPPFPYICSPPHPSVLLSTRLSAPLHICPPFPTSACPFARLPAAPYICHPHTSICSSLCASAFLSIRLPACLFSYLYLPYAYA